MNDISAHPITDGVSAIRVLTHHPGRVISVHRELQYLLHPFSCILGIAYRLKMDACVFFGKHTGQTFIDSCNRNAWSELVSLNSPTTIQMVELRKIAEDNAPRAAAEIPPGKTLETSITTDSVGKSARTSFSAFLNSFVISCFSSSLSPEGSASPAFKMVSEPVPSSDIPEEWDGRFSSEQGDRFNNTNHEDTSSSFFA